MARFCSQRFAVIAASVVACCMAELDFYALNQIPGGSS